MLDTSPGFASKRSRLSSTASMTDHHATHPAWQRAQATISTGRQMPVVQSTSARRWRGSCRMLIDMTESASSCGTGWAGSSGAVINPVEHTFDQRPRHGPGPAVADAVVTVAATGCGRPLVMRTAESYWQTASGPRRPAGSCPIGQKACCPATGVLEAAAPSLGLATGGRGG